MDPRKRQKKLERRASKRKSKQRLATRDRNAGLPQRLAAAANYPVLECGATEDVWTEGLGWAWLSRELPNGSIAVAVFLIDRYCLGVKNAVADITGRFTYEEKYLGKLRRQYGLRELAPPALRKLVESAVNYARGLGFAPHPEYHKARAIFGAIDASACAEEFEFGKDGKPFFIAGPNDSPQRCREILNTLRTGCGPDGSNFLIPVDPSDPLLLEALRRREAEFTDETNAAIDPADSLAEDER